MLYLYFSLLSQREVEELFAPLLLRGPVGRRGRLAVTTSAYASGVQARQQPGRGDVLCSEAVASVLQNSELTQPAISVAVPSEQSWESLSFELLFQLYF